MVAGADLVVDAEAHAHHPLAALELLGVFGAHAALASELAFAVGDDHLEAALGGAHGLFQRLGHRGDAVAAHRAQPFHAQRAQGLLDGHAGRRAQPVGGAGGEILLAGGGGVAVLHHDQHAVALVEQVRGDAVDAAVVPEPAVADDGDRAAVHVGGDRGRARERGRAGISPTAAMAVALCASIFFARAAIASASMRAGRASARNDATALSSTSDVYSPARGSIPLPSTRVAMSARRSSTLTACSM